MKTEDDIINCRTDGIPNEEIIKLRMQKDAKAIKTLEDELSHARQLLDIMAPECNQEMRTHIEALETAIEAIRERIDKYKPKGEWIKLDNLWVMCSKCRCSVRNIKKYNLPNFCPACGERMKSSGGKS